MRSFISSKAKSEYAFISISYPDHYFWIDDRDLKTKQKFVYLMHLFSLAEKGKTQPLPLIAIPAQKRAEKLSVRRTVQVMVGIVGADVLLLEGHPLENIKLVDDPEKNVLVIMKNGTIYMNTVK